MQLIGNISIPSLTREVASNRWTDYNSRQNPNPFTYLVGVLRKDPNKYALIVQQMLKAESKADGSDRAEARYLLGLLYLQGLGDVRPNVDKAVARFKQSNMSHANYSLGILYLKGLYGVAQNRVQGIQYLERASAQGSILANLMLGIMLWTGAEGTAKDPERAHQKLNRLSQIPAFDSLPIECQRAMAEYTIKKDPGCADYWVMKLPERERPDLHRRLGNSFWEQKNPESAMKAWTLMVKEINDRPLREQEKEAFCMAGRVWYQYRKNDKQGYAEAARLWQRAAEADHPMAHYYLGLAYCSGKGVKKDLAKGKAELMRAAELQFLPAKVMLNGLEKKEKIPLQKDNALHLPPKEEQDAIAANQNFLGKGWTWIKNHKVCIGVTLISIVAAAALLAGLGALTFFFPHVMVPIWIVAGVGTGLVVGLGGLFLLAFAAGSGDRGAQRTLGWLTR